MEKSNNENYILEHKKNVCRKTTITKFLAKDD